MSSNRQLARDDWSGQEHACRIALRHARCTPATESLRPISVLLLCTNGSGGDVFSLSVRTLTADVRALRFARLRPAQERVSGGRRLAWSGAKFDDV